MPVDAAALPPGPTVPSILQMAATWMRPAASLERLRQKYGKRITVQLPLQPPFVLLADPDEIKQVMTAPPDVIHPGEGAQILEPIVGRNSVILLDEKPHLEQRRLLLPAFHGEKMQALAGLMSEIANDEVSSWPAGSAVRLHERFQRVTLEIILRAVFGLERGSRLDALRDLLTEQLGFSASPLSVIQGAPQRFRWMPVVKRFNAAKAQADELIADLIEERRAQTDTTGNDILSMLLEARHEDDSPMSPDELRDELLTALVAGHETTASQLAWLFAELAQHPEVTAKLQAEIDKGDADAYQTATIHEIMRHRPVLANAEPRLTKQPVRIGDIEYPAGVALILSGWLVHHDPDVYPDPFSFKPERFLNAQPGTYTWLPFGGGRRRCLGASFALLEMKIVQKAILERYDVRPASSKPETTARRSITFTPSRGCEVILSRRAGSVSTWTSSDRFERSMPASSAAAAA
jgi:cytochrome P450